MTDQKHLEILKQGVAIWNKWRSKHPKIKPDFSNANGYDDFHSDDFKEINFRGADLRGANLSFINFAEADFREATLCGAEFSRTYLDRANLSHADLRDTFFEGTTFEGANLCGADFRGATIIESSISGDTLSYVNFSKINLSNANLSNMNFCDFNFRGANLCSANLQGADLRGTNFSEANLSEANLSRANLSGANFSESNLSGADLTECRVYAISTWNTKLDNNTKQKNLIITHDDEPAITVDNLKIAQFIYLLLKNEEIRSVIDTITSKVVLILGRFSKERKPVLDAIHEKLRTLNFLPIVFDFQRSAERDITETIKILAGLCCFIIADITNPKSSPLELQATIPDYMIPFVPLIQEGEQPFSMFRDLQGKYNWVLDILVYDTPSHLIEGLEEAVVKPALEKRAELLVKKVEQVRMKDIRDYLK